MGSERHWILKYDGDFRRNKMLEQHTAKPVLSIKDLRTYFHTADGIAKAVDGVGYLFLALMYLETGQELDLRGFGF